MIYIHSISEIKPEKKFKKGIAMRIDMKMMLENQQQKGIHQQHKIHQIQVMLKVIIFHLQLMKLRKCQDYKHNVKKEYVMLKI